MRVLNKSLEDIARTFEVREQLVQEYLVSTYLFHTLLRFKIVHMKDCKDTIAGLAALLTDAQDE